MPGFDIEVLRKAFADTRMHLSLAKVLNAQINASRTAQVVKCLLLPSEIECMTTMGASYIGPNFGAYFPVKPGDLVLVAFADGDQNAAFIISRISCREDKISTSYDNNVARITADIPGMIFEDLSGNKETLSPLGIKRIDKFGNFIESTTAGMTLQDKFGNKIKMTTSGIEFEDKSGNKITMQSTNININSNANVTKIDGSTFGLHQHLGNLGAPTGYPLDANTE